MQNDEAQNTDIVRPQYPLRSLTAPTPLSSFVPTLGPTSCTVLNILLPVSDQAVMTYCERLAMLQRKKKFYSPASESEADQTNQPGCSGHELQRHCRAHVHP